MSFHSFWGTRIWRGRWQEVAFIMSCYIEHYEEFVELWEGDLFVLSSLPVPPVREEMLMYSCSSSTIFGSSSFTFSYKNLTYLTSSLPDHFPLHPFFFIKAFKLILRLWKPPHFESPCCFWGLRTDGYAIEASFLPELISFWKIYIIISSSRRFNKRLGHKRNH